MQVLFFNLLLQCCLTKFSETYEERSVHFLADVSVSPMLKVTELLVNELLTELLF